MLNPSLNDLMKSVPSRYLLVNVTAQRARIIAEKADLDGIPLDEKPVKLAINEISSGQLAGRMKSRHRLEAGE